MKKYTTIPALSLSAIATAFALCSCDVDKVEDGELPEVEMKGEMKLPDYNVEGPEVETGTKKIEIPTIDVDLPEEEGTATE
ncbi:MAG: hypothetical protein ACQKBU_00330 [Verrucomicrobiales bacterium]